MSETEIPQPKRPQGRIEPRLIEREMSESYLNYALSVIHSRALPDARDGLKPSQRRILVAMNDLRLRPNAKYRKCANIAGTTSGEYHPHGESVIYPTLVRMAQKFSLRYPLIDGQGNFGSIDGDPPAAMRYTEARMAGPATEMMADLDKQTVDYQPNYDERLMEPVVLPSRFPNLLCNGSEGIAVGMATSLPPHNLREVSAALRAVLDDPDVSLGDLCQLVRGPDFPTGGIVMGRSGALAAYTSGRGRVIVRARHQFEEGRAGKPQIVFTEIPYQVRKIAIIEKIVEVVKEARITGISDVRDESDRDGIRLVVELKRGEDPEVVLKQLFQFTPLQTTYSIINLAIVDGQPKTLDLRGLLDEFIRHRKEVIRRRTRFLLQKAEERKHIVEGLRIAVDNIDEVIRIIRASSDTETARAGLMSRFDLSQAQAQAIVDMRLGRLTGLEREKLEAEFQSLLAEIADYQDILSREARVVAIIRADVEDVEQRYGDARRTEISGEELLSGFDLEELITEDVMVVTFSRDGYVKRTPLDTYRAQARGGRGIKGSEAKEGDEIKSLFVAGTHDYMLCFSDRGKVYWQKVYQVPEGARTSKGRAIRNLLPLDEGEAIQSVLRVPSFGSDVFVVFATRGGTVKKTPLEAFSRPKKAGIRAINLAEGDEVVAVGLAPVGATVLMATAKGRLVRFDESAARAMGRTAGGVRGVRLRGGDRVIGMIVADPSESAAAAREDGPEGADGAEVVVESTADVAAVDASAESGDVEAADRELTVVTACARGYGKRTPLAHYPIKGRGGQGVINIKVTARNGDVVSVRLARGGDDLLFITDGGMIVRTPASEMRPMGRNTAGVRLVNLKGEDRLVALAVITSDDLLLEAKNLAVELKRDGVAALGTAALAGEDDGFEDADDADESDEDGAEDSAQDTDGTEDDADDASDDEDDA